MTKVLQYMNIILSTALARWMLIIPLLATTVGSIVAGFLLALDAVTRLRFEHRGLLYGLPLCGVLIVVGYQKWGKGSAGGNDLLLEDLAQGRAQVPIRMAPFIFFSTLLTHLCGGSAGREGSAVQIGGSLGHGFACCGSFSKEVRAQLMLCGMAAGFAAVFGTPWTGAIFAVEVLGIGGFRYQALPLTIAGSLIADRVCGFWTVHHTVYRIAALPPDLHLLAFNPPFLAKIIIAGATFGLCSLIFAQLLFTLKKFWQKILNRSWVPPLLGGGLVILLTLILGKDDYLGLGVSNPNPLAASILKAFEPGGVDAWDWFWKLLFTVITLSSGFKGGEATPLFFIGASLGAALSIPLGLPVDFLAGLGFVAVFSAATHTRWAGTIMGAELFGSEFIGYFAIVCVTAYFFSGHQGIYRSQRIQTAKYPKWLTGRL